MTTTQQTKLPLQPEISEETKQWLHYNPNTSDIVLWVMGYAAEYGQLCREQALVDAEKKIKALMDSHKQATGECDVADCDFVAAWQDALNILEEMK